MCLLQAALYSTFRLRSFGYDARVTYYALAVTLLSSSYPLPSHVPCHMPVAARREQVMRYKLHYHYCPKRATGGRNTT